MGKIYKSWELMKAIADGEIKNGSRFNVYRTYSAIAVLVDRILHIEDGNKRILTTNDLLIYTFELIEDEINIDSIEELNDTCYYVNIMSDDDLEFYHNETRTTINKILQAVKQIDKRVKKLEN